MSDITWERMSGRTHRVTIWRDGQREAHAGRMAEINAMRGVSWLEIAQMTSQSSALQAMSEEEMARYNSNQGALGL